MAAPLQSTRGHLNSRKPPSLSSGRYEAHRKPRTSRIRAISSANTWMKGGNEDTSWLYGYDAWTVPLTADATTVGAPDVINDAT